MSATRRVEDQPSALLQDTPRLAQDPGKGDVVQVFDGLYQSTINEMAMTMIVASALTSGDTAILTFE